MKSHRFSVLLASLCMALPACADEPKSHNKEVAAFHSALAPLWHSPAGKARAEKACAQIDKLTQLAQAIKTDGAKALQEAVGVMQEKCKTNQDEADAVFGKVHDAFHHVGE